MTPEIDRHLMSAWEAAGVHPSPLVDDLLFLRRVTLDLIGRIPTRREIRAFRRAPDRTACVERLLGSADHSRWWSELWAAALNGYVDAFETNRESLRRWLEGQLSANVPYDRLVTELLTASGPASRDGAVQFIARYPDDAMVKSSRLFLGVRLDCARCHDHPFDRWTQDDFAAMQRFFASVERRGEGGALRLEDRVANQDSAGLPVFLTGSKPRTSRWRDEFALYVTHTRAFGRTVANRLWYWLMGRGVVHPPDDFSRENPASVPALLGYLASRAEALAWDTRALIREICLSDAYRRASRMAADLGSAARVRRQELFATRVVKPLTAEQLYDSLRVVAGESAMPEREDFVERYVHPQVGEDYSETWRYREGVQQIMERLTMDLGWDHGPRGVEGLYLAILTREPTDREREICRQHSAHEIAFALINSNEFCFNH